MGLLDAIRRTRTPRRPPPPRLEVADKRVLLAYLFPALGDAVLLAPVVQALLEKGAKRPVGLLLRASAARAWRHVDLPVRIHTLDEALARRPEPDDDETQALRFRLQVELQKRDYSVAVDLTARDEVDARAWLLRSEAAMRLGFLYEGEAHANTLTWGAPDERIQGLEHWTSYLAAPMTPLGLGALSPTIPFKYPPSAIQKVDELWGPHPRLVLVPGARSQDKRFDPQAFIAAGRLVRSRGGSVVVLGAPNEKRLLTSVADRCGGQVYHGRGLGPLVRIIESADAVVTNDTGPMHFAFLMNIPTVAIFVTMSVTCWGPLQASSRFATVNVPAEGVSVNAVVERLVLDRLARLLDETCARLS